MRLIGLTGRAGSGKDTVANYMVACHDFYTMAMADPIRAGLHAMLALDDEALSDRTRKEARIDWIGKSPRELMQTLGTEWGRRMIANDIWIKRTDMRLNAMRDVAHVVISDLRYDDEAAWLRGRGGEVWHIMRDDAATLTGSTASHSSEIPIACLPGDRRIYNNGTLGDLYIRIDAWLLTEQQRREECGG